MRHYRQLVAMSMELLRDEWCDEDILAELSEVIYEEAWAKVESLPGELLQTARGIIEHQEGIIILLRLYISAFLLNLNLLLQILWPIWQQRHK